MPLKNKILCIVKKAPQMVKGEIQKHRKTPPFLISISLLISLLSARAWVFFFEAHKPLGGEVSYTVGKNLVLSGYHIHHIAYGITLVSIAAWLSINYWSKNISRISSVLFGGGLGFIIDEVGFIIGGIEPYKADKEVFYIAVIIISLLVSVLYFPSFYKSMKRDIKRWKKLLFDHT